jgi:hypothetical protein
MAPWVGPFLWGVFVAAAVVAAYMLGAKIDQSTRDKFRGDGGRKLKPRRNPDDVTPAEFENFERAWDSHVSGCRRDCECGRVFWDAYNRGYDWDVGELDALEKLTAEGKATALQYAVGTVYFEGGQYVFDCDCWHKRARKIIGWLGDHGSQISEFFRLERERKLSEAARSPVVEDVVQ